MKNKEIFRFNQGMKEKITDDIVDEYRIKLSAIEPLY